MSDFGSDDRSSLKGDLYEWSTQGLLFRYLFPSSEDMKWVELDSGLLRCIRDLVGVIRGLNISSCRVRPRNDETHPTVS